MLRTLIVAYTTYAHDGRVRRHAEALARRGDHVDVICLNDGFGTKRNNVNVIGLDIPRYRGTNRARYAISYLHFFFKAATTAARLDLARRYNVVVTCTMPDAVVICGLLPKLLGSAVVLDVHDTMPELYRDKFGGRRGAIGAWLLSIQERLSAACADRVLAVHELHRRRLESSGIDTQKIRVVLNTPDPALFQLRPPRVSESGSFKIACHGTLTMRLGLDVAIEAVHMLSSRIPNVSLQVIGNGDYLGQAKTLAEQLGVATHVSFIDAVPIDRLSGLLEGSALGLVPNRESSATHLMLPVKLMEYAALGIPVIAARLRTIEHYFGGGAVRFFEPGDVVGLATAIEDLYQNPALRMQLALRAQERLLALRRSDGLYDAIDSLFVRGRDSTQEPRPARPPNTRKPGRSEANRSLLNTL